MIRHTTRSLKKKEENLVQISVKLALIFPPVTVSDAEPICDAIKAAQHWDGFHYLAG